MLQEGKLFGGIPEVYFARWDVSDHGKIELITSSHEAFTPVVNASNVLSFVAKEAGREANVLTIQFCNVSLALCNL
jgi:hypothetical protein